MNWADLAEHVGAIVTLMGLFAGLSCLLFWRLICRVENKMDELGAWLIKFLERCGSCKTELHDKFLSKEDFDKEWRPGRNGPGGLWDAINNHSHEGLSSEARVVRK